MHLTVTPPFVCSTIVLNLSYLWICHIYNIENVDVKQTSTSLDFLPSMDAIFDSDD
jgi:hypothetical protein